MDREQTGHKSYRGEKSLNYKLNLIFGLFFLFPVLGFIVVAYKYNLLQDKFIYIYFIGVLLFSLLGFIILRKVFDSIGMISKALSADHKVDLNTDLAKENNEIGQIVHSVNELQVRYNHEHRQLQRRASEISVLKDLSDLCYATFDQEEILYVTLERALFLTEADLGSILVLDQPHREKFIVKATIGLGERVKVGDTVDFDTSIAKYAVINKSPLVVQDIESDPRFSRTNRQQYGTKAFVCMPIKTSREIIGVLTLSSKQERKIFREDDVTVLTPLLSNAAFTYENLRLMDETRHSTEGLNGLGKIFKIINSSIKDTELVHSVLNELHGIIPFDSAMVFLLHEGKSLGLRVEELLTLEPIQITKGSVFVFPNGGYIDKILKQGTHQYIEDTSRFNHPVEKKLFEKTGARIFYLAPLRIGGSVKGVAVLASKGPSFSGADQDLIRWMINGLAYAVEKSRLAEIAARRDRELDTVKRIGSALASSTFEINKVIRYTMEIIRVTMNVEAGVIFILKGNILKFAVGFNIDTDSLKALRLKLGQGIAGFVAARGESVLINDFQKSQQIFPEIDRTEGFQTRSALCVPMVSQGKVIGVLEVLNKMNGGFDASDEDLLQSIAASVSIALENARLYKETVQMAEKERGVRRVFQKFVPKQVLDKIITDSKIDKPVVEESKSLTLLNLDLRGFSTLAQKMGPQKTVSLLNNFFAVMGRIVFTHHGIVDKYLGDGFLAVFGAPVSSAYDADNAIAAALEMRNSLPLVNTIIEEELGVNIKMGISVHSGEVVVGNIGFDMKMEYSVIGDTVNAVFRLQNLVRAFPNSILISEKTRHAAKADLALREVDDQIDLGDAYGAMKIYEVLSIQKNHPHTNV